MPEGYYREAQYPNRSELWLDAAAEQGMMITCQCQRCRRLVRYLAADLLPILGPDHKVMLEPPFRCAKCRSKDAIRPKVETPSKEEYGLLDVRRPSGISQKQHWRTVKLGDEVKNKLDLLPDLSGVPKTLRSRLGPPKQRGES